MTKMKKRTFLIGASLVAATALVTSVLWHTLSTADILTPKCLVQVRYAGSSGMINNVRGISVVFLQGNRTVASCIVDDGDVHHWQNLTFSPGTYAVKTYNADTGLYMKKYEINVAKDIKFEVSP